MKKIILALAIISSLQLSSQKHYTKISNSKIDQDRINLSENFIRDTTENAVTKIIHSLPILP